VSSPVSIYAGYDYDSAASEGPIHFSPASGSILVDGVWSIAGSNLVVDAGTRIDWNSAVTAGTVNFQAGNGIGLGGKVTATGTVAGYGGSIVMNAGLGNFATTLGSGSLDAQRDRWLVYAVNPASITNGPISGNLPIWGAAYDPYSPPADIVNQYVFSNPRAILLTGSNLSGTYGHLFSTDPAPTVTVSAPIPETLVGQILQPIFTAETLPTESVAMSIGTSFDNLAARPNPYPYERRHFTGDLFAGPYQINYAGGVTVNPAQIVVVPVTPTNPSVSASLTGTVSKVYDGTYNATLSPANFSLSGFLNGDSASVTKVTGTYSSKYVGTGLMVYTTLSLGDFSASGQTNLSNYELPTFVTGNIGTITAKPLTLGTLAATSKVYDGTTKATLTGGSLTGVIAGDAVSMGNLTGAFADKNAGLGKTVNVTGLALSGADAANYTIPTTAATLTADITKATLSATAGGITASNKVYDGTTKAVLTGTGTLTGIIAGDTVTLAAPTGSFADKNAGTAKTITVTGFALSGADAGNYTATTTSASLKADITPKSLSVSAVTVANKVYDGTTAATLTAGAPVGAEAGDTVTLSATNTAFNDKNAGTGKDVTVSGLTLGGADATNYTLGVSSATTKADITPKAVTVDSITAANKVYDGTTTATLSGGVVAGAIAADNVTIGTPVGSFSDKNAGTGKTVTITGVALAGSDALNYTLASGTATAKADITPKALTVSSVSASNKMYDGTTTVTLSGGALIGAIAGDAVGISTPTGSFNDKNAGFAKPITVTGLNLFGADLANYTVTTGGVVASANITERPVTVDGIVASDKVYDGNTAVVLSGGVVSGAVAGDSVFVGSTSGSFVDKNVGNAKTISLTALALGGTDASNYRLLASALPSANITAKALTVGSVSAVSKVYDGTTTVNLSGGTLEGAVAGDSITLTTPTGSFNDKNVGTAKPVTVSGLALSGADVGNYLLSNTTANFSATADITARPLTVSAVTAANKEYDGTTAVVLSGGKLEGAIASDNVALTAPAGSFDNKNVGTAKPITVTGLALTGSDLGNYTVTKGNVATSADITPKTVNVSAITAASKVYDGTTTATLTGGTLSGTIAGESVALGTLVGTFDSKNVGTAKPVAIAGLALTGADVGNYKLVTANTSASADITAKPLTIAGITAANKVYDGKTNATLSGGTLTGVVAGDSVALSAPIGTFADKNAGTAKAVNVTGLALSGADLGNYTVTAGSTSTTADITVRPSSTWSGAAGTNNWFDAGNWDALPDGANVLAVNIGNTGAGSGTVAFDSGSVTLQNLSSGQTLAMGGGTLQVSGALTTSGFSQTGGTVSGAGSFTASGSFNQTGGNIDMASIAATQSSGNMTVNNLKAASVNLTGGSISQSAAGGLETTTLTTQSTGGTTLTGTGNKIVTWNAFNTGSGALRLSNTGLITVTAINDGGDFNIDSFGGVVTKGQVKTSGAISITANSPLVVGPLGLSAGGNIALVATNLTSAGNITLDGPIVSTTGSVAMKAASNLTQNSSISAPQGVSADAGGKLEMGPLATSGVLPVIYVVASQPVTPPPPPGALTTASEMVVALIATAPAVETPAEKQVQAAAEVPVKEKDKEKDTSKETVVAEGGVCRP
jgi:hypothetical protein